MSAPSPSPLRPIPFRALIDQAMALTRGHFRPIYPLPAALFTAGHTLIVVAQMRMFAGLRMAPGGVSPSALFAGLGLFGVFMLAYWLTVGLATATTTAVAVDVVGGRPVRLGYRLGGVLRPRFWGTLLLAGGLTLLSMLLCFFPAIYVGLLFFLVIPVMVEEGRFGPAALGRSKDLIRYNPQGRFLNAPMVKAAVIGLVIWLLSATAGVVVQVPFGIVKQILLFRAIAAHGAGSAQTISPIIPWLDFPAALLNGLITAAIQLYGAFAVALFFFDLRARKEGLDLERALAELEAAGAPPTPGVDPGPPAAAALESGAAGGAGAAAPEAG